MRSIRRVPIIVFFSAIMSHSATLELVPNASSFAIGDTISLDLRAFGFVDGFAPSIGVFDLDVHYDPSLLTFQALTHGIGLDVLGLGSLQVSTPSVGVVNVFELSLDTSMDLNTLQPGTFTLATMNFIASSGGNTPLILQINAIGDADGTTLAPTIVNATITVLDSPSPTSVPEPATVFYIATAILTVLSLTPFRLRILSRTYRH